MPSDKAVEPRNRILIADDSTVDRVILKQMLSTIGFRHVDEAENGNLAMFKVKTALDMSSGYDLIMLDWRMPEQDSLKTLASIRAFSKMKNVPVLFLTGVAERTDVERALGQGVSGYIIKPVNVEVLTQKLVQLGFVAPEKTPTSK